MMRVVICQFTYISTAPRKTDTTSSVERDNSAIMRVNVLGISESVILKTVGMSAPR